MRIPDTGYDVFALCIAEELTVETALARRRIAGKGNARPAVLAHVAVDHRHDGHRGPEVGRNTVDQAVLDGPFVVPTAEDGLDRAP